MSACITRHPAKPIACGNFRLGLHRQAEVDVVLVAAKTTSIVGAQIDVRVRFIADVANKDC